MCNNYVLFTTPRSGSTYAASIIYRYLKTFEHYNGYLSEFFTNSPTHFFSVVRDQSSGKFVVAGKPKDRMTTLSDPAWDDMVRDRIEMIGDKTVFLKVLSRDTLNTRLKKWLYSTRTPIFLERKNKVEQFLSWCVVLSGGQSHSFDGTPIVCDKFVAKQEWFDMYRNALHLYQTELSEWDSAKRVVLYYEDIVDDPSLEWLKKIREPNSHSGVLSKLLEDKNGPRIPHKSRFGEEIERYCTNYEEIVNWCSTI